MKPVDADHGDGEGDTRAQKKSREELGPQADGASRVHLFDPDTLVDWFPEQKSSLSSISPWGMAWGIALIFRK